MSGRLRRFISQLCIAAICFSSVFCFGSQRIYAATQVNGQIIPFDQNGFFTDALNDLTKAFSYNGMSISNGSAAGIGGEVGYYSGNSDFKSISMDVTYNKWALNFTEADELQVFEAQYDEAAGTYTNTRKVELVRKLCPELMANVQNVKATYVSAYITPGTKYLRILMPGAGYFSSTAIATDFKLDAVTLESTSSSAVGLDGYIVDKCSDFSLYSSGSDTSNLLAVALDPVTSISAIRTFGTNTYIKRVNSNMQTTGITYSAPAGKDLKSAYVEGYYYQNLPSTNFELWISKDGASYLQYSVAGSNKHTAFGASTNNSIPDVLQINYLPEGTKYVQVRLPVYSGGGFPYLTKMAFGYGAEVTVPPMDTDIVIVSSPSAITLDGNVDEDTDGNPAGEWSGAQMARITGITDNNGGKHTAKIYYKYDFENLYVGAKIKDPTPMRNTRIGSNIWNGDCLELFIGDEDLDCTEYPDKAGTLLPSDRQLVVSAGTDFGFQYYLNINNVYSTPSVLMEIKKDADGKGYTMEMAIPLEALGLSKPWEGTQIIMNAVLNDGDYAGRGQWGWTTTGESAKKARGQWGRAVFENNMPPADEITVNASVDNITQQVTISGRIQQSGEQYLGVTVSNPEGRVAHIDQTKSDSSGNYAFSYNLNTNATGNGTYGVTVGGIGIAPAASTTFTFRYEATSVITSSAIVFDKNLENLADVMVPIDFKGNTLVSVIHDNDVLSADADYVTTGSAVIISKDYLSTLPVGFVHLLCDFNEGADATVEIQIIDTTSRDATLSGLRILQGEIVPGFSTQEDTYLVLVDKDTRYFSMIPTTTALKYASIDINGSQVKSGEEYIAHLDKKAVEFKITITAEDGITRKTYIVAAVWTDTSKLNTILSRWVESFTKKYENRLDEAFEILDRMVDNMNLLFNLNQGQ